ncbi:MAG: hypothetical protein LBT52_04420 [Clostridiales Family XIII bacterium]|nr:hypothetical protein [Clostridiales Family XIII bacterium]
MISAKSTDVRREFSEFLDEAMKQPQYMKRRKQIYITLPYEALGRIFPDKLSVIAHKDNDGSYYTENTTLPDIIGFGPTKEDAISSLMNDLVAYAYEYNDNYALYSVAPNRVKHLPTVMKIISKFEKDGDISDILEVR